MSHAAPPAAAAARLGTDPGAGWALGRAPFRTAANPPGSLAHQGPRCSETPVVIKAYKMWFTHEEQRTCGKPGHHSKRD